MPAALKPVRVVELLTADLAALRSKLVLRVLCDRLKEMVDIVLGSLQPEGLANHDDDLPDGVQTH